MIHRDGLSITAAAKHVGISRPRLSKLIAENGIEKDEKGRVSLHDVQTLLQTLSAQGRIRSPKRKNVKKDSNEQLVEHLQSEILRLKKERDDLADKNKALSSLESEVKLLKAATNEDKKTIENLEIALAASEKKQGKAGFNLTRTLRKKIIAALED